MSIQKIMRMSPQKPARKTVKGGGAKVKTTKGKRVARDILEEPKASRKSRRIYNFSYEFLSQYFYMSQKSAAKQLGVAAITLKRCGKRGGFEWPFRANKYKVRAETMASKAATAKPAESTKPTESMKLITTKVPASVGTMTEAARAFSRLPVDCMAENHGRQTDVRDTTGFCEGVGPTTVTHGDEAEGVGHILVSLQRCLIRHDVL